MVVARLRRRALVAFSSPSPLVAAAIAAGWGLDKPERSLLALLDRRLEGRGARSVAVLSGQRGNRFADLIRTAYPDLAVTVGNARRSPSRLHATLAAAGRFDLVLDDVGVVMPAARLWRATFFHVGRGGAYIVPGHRVREGAKADLGALVARLRATAAAERPGPAAAQRARDDFELGRSISDVATVAGHLVVESSVDALAKLYDAELDTVLAHRPGGADRTLQTVPGAEFKSGCVISQSTGGRSRGMPEVYDAPPVSLREYHDVLCSPGQVVTTGNLLLPDSFRHNQRKRLTNRYTDDLAPRFATLAGSDEESPRLSGSYFYLDDEVRGHFGHAMTEQLSRLWAVPLARRLAPDLKAVLAINKGRELQPFELELYGTVGFEPDDLVFLRAPARVERLLAATPMFSMPQYVHPEIRHTWKAVGDKLAASAPERRYSSRIFVSRRIRKRACLNTDEVEALFAAHGFDVVYPEDYPLGEQVAMFRHADVIGGFAGSGLFHICFAESPKLVVMLSHAAYTARNEYMMASVLGHQIVSVVSEPDRRRSPGEKINTFQSTFSFDFENEGRYLSRVLGGL